MLRLSLSLPIGPYFSLNLSLGEVGVRVSFCFGAFANIYHSVGEDFHSTPYKRSPTGEIKEENMADIGDDEEAPRGFEEREVINHLKGLDPEALDNSFRAAWKVYVGCAMLSLAKGVEKGDLIDAVFGKDVKPSKTFQNCYSIAAKAFEHVLDELGCLRITSYPMTEALQAILVAIDEDMKSLSVSSKNDYDKVCGRSEKKKPEDPTPKPDTEANPDDTGIEPGSSDVDGSPSSGAATQPAHETDMAVSDAVTAELPTSRIIGALEHAPKEDLVLLANRIFERIELQQLRRLRDELSRKISELERDGYDELPADAA